MMPENSSRELAPESDLLDQETISNIPLFFDYCEEHPALGVELSMDHETMKSLLQGLLERGNDPDALK